MSEGDAAHHGALSREGAESRRAVDRPMGRGVPGSGGGERSWSQEDRQPLTWATADGSPGQVEPIGSLEGPGFEPYLTGKGSPRILRTGIPIPGSELQAKRARHSAIGLREGSPESRPSPHTARHCWLWPIPALSPVSPALTLARGRWRWAPGSASCRVGGVAWISARLQPLGTEPVPLSKLQ